MPRFPGVEFGFENQHRAECHPEARQAPSTLDEWTQRNYQSKPRAKPKRRLRAIVWELAPEILVVATVAIVLIVAGLA